MTGKNTRNYHQQILEYINEEGYTLLPTTILTSLVDQTQNKPTNFIVYKIIFWVLKQFNTSIKILSEVYNINNENNKMNKRFDTLFNLISKTTWF